MQTCLKTRVLTIALAAPVADSTALTPVCERGTIVSGIPRLPTSANPAVEVCHDQIGTTDHFEIADPRVSGIPLPAVLCERNRRPLGASHPHGSVLQVQERPYQRHPLAIRRNAALKIWWARRAAMDVWLDEEDSMRRGNLTKMAGVLRGGCRLPKGFC